MKLLGLLFFIFIANTIVCGQSVDSIGNAIHPNISYFDAKELEHHILRIDSLRHQQDGNQGVFYYLQDSGVGNFIQVILLLLQLAIILFGLRQYRDNLKYSRRQTIYEGFMELEKDINEENKEVWGLSRDNTFINNDGEKIEYSLEELKHMVLLIDLFAFERGHSKKYSNLELNENNILFKLFQKDKFREYWKYVIKPCFFSDSRFATVIDKTVKLIEKSKLSDITEKPHDA